MAAGERLSARLNRAQGEAAEAKVALMDAVSSVERLTKAVEVLNARIKATEAERDEAKSTAQSLQLQLQRTLGWIDRVLEREDATEAPQFEQVPLQRPARGPAIDRIPVPNIRQGDRWGGGTMTQHTAYDGTRRY